YAANANRMERRSWMTTNAQPYLSKFASRAGLPRLSATRPWLGFPGTRPGAIRHPSSLITFRSSLFSRSSETLAIASSPRVVATPMGIEHTPWILDRALLEPQYGGE